MQVFIIVLIAQVIASLVNPCSYDESLSHSSAIKTTASHMLSGFTFRSQRVYDILKCAQLCLGDNRCLSFNYEDRIDGECRLNNQTAVAQDDSLYYSKRFTYGEMRDRQRSGNQDSDCVFVFTTLGAKGKRGPIDTHGYNGTNLDGSVTLDSGLQLWRVPQTAVYSIEANGASGANGTCKNDSEVCHRGGLGARIIGSFHLVKDTMLTILVGQKGQLDKELGLSGGGGGGGSFVVSTDQQLPLVVAGGGGGGGKPITGLQDGDPGQEKENGSRCGGLNGKGGKFCNSLGAQITQLYAGSGAGFYGDGVYFPGICSGAQSFSNGGLGGEGPSSTATGGFGGGGYGMEHGGGGGGYSGGGIVGAPKEGFAGGGGSFNSGSSQANKAGVSYGDGRVIITMLQRK
ncbi:loricrin-like [Actinia tenebrosa]|uniref:receptor protein-tyrosine kinase n=1 Tax=Actinia tenebrosa TaxID=6105 RepID=A0A6P8H5A7_ACTTE|nr:loricrin-like [Actinia tenebrosa]